MLVVSRKSDQQIRIGDGVVMEVLSIQSNTVRIGIDAPREIQVRRLELPEVVAKTVDARPNIVSPRPSLAIVELSRRS